MLMMHRIQPAPARAFALVRAIGNHKQTKSQSGKNSQKDKRNHIQLLWPAKPGKLPVARKPLLST